MVVSGSRVKYTSQYMSLVDKGSGLRVAHCGSVGNWSYQCLGKIDLSFIVAPNRPGFGLQWRSGSWIGFSGMIPPLCIQNRLFENADRTLTISHQLVSGLPAYTESSERYCRN